MEFKFRYLDFLQQYGEKRRKKARKIREQARLFMESPACYCKDTTFTAEKQIVLKKHGTIYFAHSGRLTTIRERSGQPQKKSTPKTTATLACMEEMT